MNPEWVGRSIDGDHAPAGPHSFGVKLSWFYRPDATMRRAYAIGVTAAALLVFCVFPVVQALFR